MLKTILASASVLALLATPALAQSSDASDGSRANGAGAAPEMSRPTNSASDNAGVEDIIVTARRQQEALIDVPVTVTALTAKKLDALGLQDFKQVANFAPGFIINAGQDFNSRAAASIIVRGMTPSVSANASVFIDGVPVSSGVVEGVDDVARIEILRGPQTAYFGRSTFAGALNFVTKTPDMRAFRGRGEVTIGDYETRDLRAQVEGPLVRDVLAFRIGGRYLNRNGTRKNVADGSRYGNQETSMLTAALRFTPGDRFAVNLYGFTQRDDDGPTNFKKISVPNYNCNAGANPGGPFNYICGVLPYEGAIRLSSDNDTTAFVPTLNQTEFFNATGERVTPLFRKNFLYRTGNERRVEHAHIAAEYDADIVRLSLLAGFNNTRNVAINDVDNEFSVPASTNFLVRREGFAKDYFIEGRITSDPDKPIRAMLGGSYAWSRNALFVVFRTGAGAVGFGGLGAINQAKTPAAFGSITWDVTPQITLSAEGRYQVDKVAAFRRSQNRSTQGTVLVRDPLTGPRQIPTLITADSFKSFTPRLIAQYRPIPGTMVFASYSEGTNPGAFNTAILAFDPGFQSRLIAATGASAVVKPESLENYELGIKSQFWGNRAQVIASIYTANWTDQIVPVTYQEGPSAVGLNVNIGKTRLKGFEIEGTVRPIPAIELSGSFFYNSSNIKSYVCIACRPYAGGNVSVIGNSLPRAPRYGAAASAQFTQPISGDIDGYVRGDFYYKGSQYTDETNLTRTHPQRVFNARLGVQNDIFRVEGFVTNIFNNRGPTSVLRQQDIGRGFQYNFQVGYPELRRIGVRASYNFGG